MVGRRAVAVAGTHGKTTTTSLLTVALQAAGADPSYAVGGDLAQTGTNAAEGPATCSSSRPTRATARSWCTADAAVVTNVEADHLDQWGTEEAYRAGFTEFVGRIDPEGFLVCRADDPGAAALVDVARGRGLAAYAVGEAEAADVRCVDLVFAGETSAFTVLDGGAELGRVTLRIPGRAPRAGRPGGARPSACASATSSTTCVAASRASPAPGGGWSARARPRARGSTTPRTPPAEIAGDLQAARCGRGRGPGRRGLPVESLVLCLLLLEMVWRCC